MTSAHKSKLVAVLTLILAMISVQSGAAHAKELFDQLGPMGLSGLRSTFAALVLAAFWRPWTGAQLTRRDWAMAALYGGSLGLMNMTFYMGLQRLPLGVAVAVEFVGPFCVALVSSRKPLDFLWLGLAVVGLLGLNPLGHDAVSLDPLGVLFALIAGGFWAAYILFGHRVGRSMPGGRASALGQIFAALAVAPFTLTHAGPAMLSPPLLASAFVVAMLSGAIPFSLEMVSLKRLPAKTFSILVSLEPAVGAAIGWLYLGEQLTYTQSAAMAALMIASLGCTATAKR